MNLKRLIPLGAISSLLLLIYSCGNSEQASENKTNHNDHSQSISINTPHFNADSAYSHIEAQLSFGFRIPGTPGQQKCAAWMQDQLQNWCDTVYRQEAKVKAGNGEILPCINLIGSIHPQASKRILLLTHWDSRPWADEDDSAQTKPILAADDGASGVAVLIELSRLLKSQAIDPNLGIDILFTDVEDYGKSEWGEDTYCLGTQYWARHPHVPGYTAMFGILLDMVGARGASFPQEYISMQYAGSVIQKVYQSAQRAGYSSYFPFRGAGGIDDDHKYVNEMMHIPTIDIINLNTVGSMPFKPHWHTHDDNLSIIDKATLKAVGQTLLQVIYEESASIQTL